MAKNQNAVENLGGVSIPEAYYPLGLFLQQVREVATAA